MTYKELKKKSRHFSLKNEVLVKVRGGNTRTAVPKILRTQVIQQCHSDMTAGHFGITRTLKKVQNNYVWPNMRKDVHHFVRCCITCQMYKDDQRKPPGHLAPRKITGVWEVCNSDICGPFPTSTSGNSYIVVFQDDYSKAVEIAAIKRATAKTIAKKFIELVYSRHGSPRFLKSDNGKAYCAKILEHVCTTLGTEQHHILPYRPNANPSERVIKDISRIIASYAGDKHDTWDRNLHLVSLAINSAYQFSSHLTPYEVLYGRTIRLPVLSDHHLYEGFAPPSPEDYVHQLRTHIKEVHKLVDTNLKKAAQRQKHYYDKGRRTDRFDIGDYVWLASHHLSDAAHKFAAKLAPKRHGPFKIIEKKNDCLYTLQNTATGERKNAHIDQLQIFFSDNDPLPDEEVPGATGGPVTASSSPSSANDTGRRDAGPQLLREGVNSDNEDDLVCGFASCAFEEENEWIFCDLCDCPFHVKCVGITLAEAESMDFVCPKCRAEAT